MSEQSGPPPELVFVPQVQYEMVQPPIHRNTAFCLYAAAVVQGLCSVRNPQSKEEIEMIVSMAHHAAQRMVDGPLRAEQAR